MIARTVKQGDIVRHFKHTEDGEPNNYMYKIIAVGKYVENEKPCVVYQALYGKGEVWVREAEEFLSEVDGEKYPNATQKYRFEVII